MRLRLALIAAAFVLFLPLPSDAVWGRNGLSGQRLEEVLKLIQANYIRAVDIDLCRQQIMMKGVEACLDQYSRYVPPVAAQLKHQNDSGSFGNVSGINGQGIVQSASDTVLKEAGLEPGDRIVAIDGRTTQGLNPQEVILLLRGKPGSRVLLTVMRQGKTFQKTVVRQEEVYFVVHHWLEGSVGYIRIDTFDSKQVFGEIKEALHDLVDQHGACGILFDIRNNPGGYTAQAIDTVKLFAAAGDTIIASRSRNFLLQWFQSSKAWANGPYRGLPVVILQDADTASAAEMFSGAMRLLGATVVGQKSFGKGIWQTRFGFSDGAELWITTAEWFLKDGTSIHGKGVQPNVSFEASMPKLEARDQAFAILQSKTR